MQRYIDTVFRSWWVALLPILVLLALYLAMNLHSPKETLAVTRVWVNEAGLKQLGHVSNVQTPAQNMQANLNQLLLNAKFDMAVAKGSPSYWRTIAPYGATAANRAVADFSRNVEITVVGPNVLSLSYSTSTTNPGVGLEVVRSLARAASLRTI